MKTDTLKRGSNFGGKCNIYEKESGRVVAIEVDSDKADKICKAVNNYDALLSALKNIRDCFWTEGESDEDRIYDIKNMAKEAIKKAEELK